MLYYSRSLIGHFPVLSLAQVNYNTGTLMISDGNDGDDFNTFFGTRWLIIPATDDWQA